MFRIVSKSGLAHVPFRSRSLSTVAKAKERWNNRVVFTEEVEHALEKGLPVVALESAIITHGMPYPTNLTTAQSVESIIASHSVVPATIALHKSRIHIGLSPSLLAQLSEPSSSSSNQRTKVSRRDIAPTLGLGWTGGTTVAATMVVAQSVGIDIFVTGGIGGVHRGAQESMDVSADLIELGRTPMAVVCAGAKSILDIPRTLEVLETQGVCVATLGSSFFPAFYSPSSGEPSPWSVKSIEEAASVIHTGLTLPTPQATLLAVPIPANYEPAGLLVQESVEQAVRESIGLGIDKRGKEVTPWLLKRVGELTKGSALELNVKLIENNASIGAQVASRVAQLHASRSQYSSSSTHEPFLPRPIPTHYPLSFSPLSTPPSSLQTPSPSPARTPILPPPTVLVFGSAAIDLTSTSPTSLSPRSTTPGTVFLSPGGVGRNIAEAAQRFLPPHNVMLVSPIGTEEGIKVEGFEVDEGHIDAFGKVLKMEMRAAAMRTDGLLPIGGGRTAVCSLMLERDGDLVVGVADMGIVERLGPDHVKSSILTHRPKIVVFDLNLSQSLLSTLLSICDLYSIPTFCDPTSIPKLPRLIPTLRSKPHSLTHISPNILELELLYSSLALNDDSVASQLVEYGREKEQEQDQGQGGIGGQLRVDPDWGWKCTASLGLGSSWRVAFENWTRSLSNQSISMASIDANDGNGDSSEDVGRWVRESGVVTQMIACLPWCKSFWLKAGSKGLIHLSLEPLSSSTTKMKPTANPSWANFTPSQTLRHTTPRGILTITHYPSPRINPNEIISTTGAGDTLVGGIVAGLVSEKSEAVFVKDAVNGVGVSLRTRRAVA